MPPLDKLTGQLGSAKATHLLRRATFGPTPKSIQQFSSLTIDQALDILFADVAEPAPPIDPSTGSTWLNPSAPDGVDQENLMDYFMAWQLELMRNSGNSIKERIVWFLHTHMPTRRTLALLSEHLYYQNKLYRYYALGSFKTLFRKLCIDNAMLIYLDNGTNRYLSPNENFAREMFELYTIGRGNQTEEPGNYTNYTEEDIKAAAKVLTGYEIDETFGTLDSDTSIPSGKIISELSGADFIATEHNPGSKQFSAAFQNRTITPAILADGFATVESAAGELDEMINMIFDQDETARFITRKIYRFFVYYKIDASIEENIITPLASIFKTNNYSLPHLIKALLGSQHFYDTDNAVTSDDNLGAIIKSPIEVIIGTCRMFDVTFPTAVSDLYQTVYQNGLIEFIYKQGLELYEPYDVAGYDAYYQFPSFNRNWITPHYLAYRYLFANQIINGVNLNDESLGITLDILSWVDNTENIIDPTSADDLVSRFIELLFPFPVKSERLTFFIEEIFLFGTNRADWTTSWNNYKGSVPGYESSVRNWLNSLLIALMQSPEYQLL